jgi:hypothetical protein
MDAARRRRHRTVDLNRQASIAAGRKGRTIFLRQAPGPGQAFVYIAGLTAAARAFAAAVW